jgi:hypothetical protein
MICCILPILENFKARFNRERLLVHNNNILNNTKKHFWRSFYNVIPYIWLTSFVGNF